MPKMKTKSGAKKRFSITGTGKVKAKQAKTSHMMMNKSNSMKRKARGLTVLDECNGKVVVNSWMPYARIKNRGAKIARSIARLAAKQAAKAGKAGQ